MDLTLMAGKHGGDGGKIGGKTAGDVAGYALFPVGYGQFPVRYGHLPDMISISEITYHLMK